VRSPALFLAALTVVPAAAHQRALETDISQAVAALPAEHRAAAEVWQVRDGPPPGPLPVMAPGMSKTDLFAQRRPDGGLPDMLRYDVTIYFPNQPASGMTMPSADAALGEVGVTFMSAGSETAHVHIRRWVPTAKQLDGGP